MFVNLYRFSLLCETFCHSLEYSSSLTENKSKNIDFVVKFDGNLNDKGQSAYYI